METESEYVMGIISAPQDAAMAIARAVVEKKAAACAQITAPIHSIYFWEGCIHEDDEVLILVKTRQEKTGIIQELLDELHPYDVPEFIMLPVLDGNRKYLSWIDTALRR
ncbi:MAG: divalent-cation tolerance protein CutA [Spirochaetales bacterium]|nr:divalent-cation tolerance protein CutA [Spirochaetales bacterium]